MSQLVARPWHSQVLRRLRAIRNLPACPWHQSASVHWEPKSGMRRKRTISASSVSSAIVIPTSVNQDSAELIRHVHPWKYAGQSSQRKCVVFVTPAFVKWLSTDHAFLKQLVNRVYNGITGKAHTRDISIQVVCAVVHALPTIEGDTTNPVSLGYEGIAYAALRNSESISAPKKSSSQAGVIDFVVRESISDDSVLKQVVRIPLANTVFQNGAATTLFETQWKKGKGQRSFKMVKKQDTAYQQLDLLDDYDFKTGDLTLPQLRVPLLPLTKPRIVNGCMGNIVRGIIGADGKSATASTELEAIVPRYFQARRQPAQTTTAWALVIPQELQEGIKISTEKMIKHATNDHGGEHVDSLESWEMLWRDSSFAWNNVVSGAILDGARLHRVLSGGGGWGKKAGILSLDPVPAMLSQAMNPQEALSEAPEDFATTLTPVVHEGDAIQFFVSPTPDLAALAKESDNENSLKIAHNAAKISKWNLHLGTVPSTMDIIPGQSWQYNGGTSKPVYSFHGVFGALVEGGLTLAYMQNSKKLNGAPPSMLRASVVDVPFSRYLSKESTKPQNATGHKPSFPIVQGLTFDRAQRFYKLQMRTIKKRLERSETAYWRILEFASLRHARTSSETSGSIEDLVKTPRPSKLVRKVKSENQSLPSPAATPTAIHSATLAKTKTANELAQEAFDIQNSIGRLQRKIHKSRKILTAGSPVRKVASSTEPHQERPLFRRTRVPVKISRRVMSKSLSSPKSRRVPTRAPSPVSRRPSTQHPAPSQNRALPRTQTKSRLKDKRKSHEDSPRHAKKADNRTQRIKIRYHDVLPITLDYRGPENKTLSDQVSDWLYGGPKRKAGRIRGVERKGRR